MVLYIKRIDSTLKCITKRHAQALSAKNRIKANNMAQHSKLDNDSIVALHEAGKSCRAISAIAGISKTSIAKRLKHLTPRKSTEIFKELKADIFAEKQRKLLMSSDKLTPKEQRDIAVAVGCYHDKEQQLRGNSSDGKPLVIINRISINDRMQTTNEQIIEVGS